ncbi:MAG: hypothetical protein CO075_01645, partial [Candidatus Moranbacteria bacterium CG_4_9_14_0_8_um_filter_41_43]
KKIHRYFITIYHSLLTVGISKAITLVIFMFLKIFNYEDNIYNRPDKNREILKPFYSIDSKN